MDDKRLVSLDAFRGFTVAAMILVNNPGDWNNTFGLLLHAEWRQMITPTDLIFPFFLFIVGVSVVLAYGKQRDAGKPASGLRRKILWRGLKIFALGIFLSLYPDFNFAEMRIPGVLQRIAIVFMVCALLFLYSSWKTQAIWGAVFLVMYWAVMFFVPVPGLGAGLLEPGQNVAAWLDSMLIPGSLWEGNWDPEGILSTIPSLATGICGMMAGHLISSNLSRERKLVWLYLGGFCALTAGYFWGWSFPINKHIWTSSYALYTAGLASLALASFIWVVDELGYRKWTAPGVIYGTNPIAAYFLAGVFTLFVNLPEGAGIQHGLMQAFGAIGMSPKLASLAWALFYNVLCFLPIYLLYRRRIFIKL